MAARGVASAQHGRGWIGHLVAKYHIQSWVQRNTPKLAGYAQSLSKSAPTVGKGAVSLIIELLTLFVLVLLLLLEGPKMRSWTLGQMTPGRLATVTRIAADVSQKVTGYMFGDLLTSLIAGTVVFVTLLILGVPFPLLWGLWVALVDFLPMIGGALAGIPTVLFAFGLSADCGPRSGHDLGLLAFELLGRDDAPVAQVSELGQLVRRAGWRTRSLLDGGAQFAVLLLRLLHRPLLHAAAADDQVNQDTDQRDDEHEQEPEGLGPAAQVTAAEDVDEYVDQDPDPDHPQDDLDDRPEDIKRRIVVGTG
jgi:hypothetical protein